MFVTMENASQTGNPTVGGLFKVGDRKKLDSFLGWLSQKSGFTSFEEDGITFLANTQGADMPVVAYDETALLVYTAPVDNDQAKAAAKKLFAQKKTESLMGNSQLAQAIERPSDMKFVMDYGSVMAVAGEQIGTAGLSGFEFLNKMSMRCRSISRRVRSWPRRGFSSATRRPKNSIWRWWRLSVRWTAIF